jgi:SnoaL-like domain
MDSAKSLSQPNSGRRSFLWKAGAAMSAAVAAAVPGMAKSGTHQGDGKNAEVNRLAHRLGILEDEKTIRTMHEAYESRLDQGMYEEVVNMFAPNAEVVYNGGLFAGQNSLRRLYCNLFPSGLTGKKMAPAPGFEPVPLQQQDIVEVAADRKTASGQFPYSIQVGTPMTGDSSLVEMARLQGEGIIKWWEGGTCQVSYVKVDDAWKISRLEYRVISKADYKPGRTYANPIDVPAFSSVFPVNPTGPDRLV